MELNKQQKSCLNRLRRLEKVWAKDLWIFAGSGSFCLMRLNEHGEQAMLPNGSVDQDYIVERYNIPCDGGDW